MPESTRRKEKKRGFRNAFLRAAESGDVIEPDRRPISS